MVQIHLGPQNVSPVQDGIHPDEHPVEATGMPSNSKKTQRRFLGLDVLGLSGRSPCSVATTVQLRHDAHPLALFRWIPPIRAARVPSKESKRNGMSKCLGLASLVA